MDYDEPISRGINNESIESLSSYMRTSLLASNLSINMVILSDFDQFVSEVEDDPNLCKIQIKYAIGAIFLIDKSNHSIFLRQTNDSHDISDLLRSNQATI